jgi:Rieske Fe-S protein
LKKGIEISRRRFLKASGNAMLLLAGAMWYGLMKRHTRPGHAQTETVSISSLHNGVNFFGSILVLKEGNRYRAFSNKCTHLGCTIQKMYKGKLVCPCHGSEFNFSDGSVVKGPAAHALNELELSSSQDEITVKLI